MTIRVALLSYAFRPSMGGIERVSDILEAGLRHAGYDVRIATMSSGPDEANVVRRPSTLHTLRLLRWCDVVVESNVSIRLSWPVVLRLVRRPRLTVLHTPITIHHGGRMAWVDAAKVRLLPRSSTYAVSRWLGTQLPIHVDFMPNPFDPSDYGVQGRSQRSGVLFVGRLTRAKGLDVLLNAFALINVEAALTVVGDGVERSALQEQAQRLGLNVRFLGALDAAGVRAQMSKASVLCIPSISDPPEVFPLVALEGLASGCQLVATDSGGLPEALGSHGTVVPERSVEELARAVERALRAGPIDADEERARRTYLTKFTSENVVRSYVDAIERLAREWKR